MDFSRPLYNGNGNWGIGTLASNDGSYALYGDLQEVRASSTNRSAGWIGTEYSNQNSPGTFYSLGTEQSGGGGGGGGDYITTYSYDALSHLAGVSMPRSNGTQTRTFNYGTPPGNLLLSATNPENGTVTYTYSSHYKVVTRVDAKGQKVAYSYDSYARLTKVQRYPNGTTEDTCQQENYYYDSNPFDGSYSQNVSGRLAAVQYYGGYGGGTCNTTFTEMYSYNSGGARLGKRLRLTRSGLSNLDLNGSFTYDNEGRMTGEQYPLSGPNLSYGFDAMGRLYSLTAGDTIVGSATYGAAGNLLGLAGGAYGSETRTYNSILQLTQLSSTGLNLQYHFPSSGNSGKSDYQYDVVSGEQVNYTYDSLNRLATAVTSDNSNVTQWGQSYSYDGFGSLTAQTV